MASDQAKCDPQLQSQRPIEFRSTSEEVAIGTLMGCLIGSFGTILLGGPVGALGDRAGKVIGCPVLVGGAFVWLAFWVVPLVLLAGARPLWRFIAASAAGAAYMAILQWHIHQRDIGAFYPWIVSALPFGIVMGTSFEPIRLARGGSTEEYLDRGVFVGGGIVGYGNRNAMFLAIGSILGIIADLVSLGRQRAGASIGGLLGGGLTALAASSLVAWRGDSSVAALSFGSVWNIAWAGTGLGALTGAVSGWRAGVIRQQQQRLHQSLLENGEALTERTSSDQIREAT